jgi:hypothetical protein
VVDKEKNASKEKDELIRTPNAGIVLEHAGVQFENQYDFHEICYQFVPPVQLTIELCTHFQSCSGQIAEKGDYQIGEEGVTE